MNQAIDECGFQARSMEIHTNIRVMASIKKLARGKAIG
jgi:hypothetical protein